MYPSTSSPRSFGYRRLGQVALALELGDTQLDRTRNQQKSGQDKHRPVHLGSLGWSKDCTLTLVQHRMTQQLSKPSTQQLACLIGATWSLIAAPCEHSGSRISYPRNRQAATVDLTHETLQRWPLQRTKKTTRHSGHASFARAKSWAARRRSCGYQSKARLKTSTQTGRPSSPSTTSRPTTTRLPPNGVQQNVMNSYVAPSEAILHLTRRSHVLFVLVSAPSIPKMPLGLLSVGLTSNWRPSSPW